MKSHFLSVIAISLFYSCIGQESKVHDFGTKNIDHKSIAIKYMENIKNGNYQQCYSMVSEKYKTNINLEDFTFKMQMLRNIAANDDFHHYNTTFIGKTLEADLRAKGETKKLKDIMPEYDFTLESEKDQEFKQNRIWLRFENENSDKIGVINFAFHTAIKASSGMSRMSMNPFITGSYILIIINNKNELFIDLRGGNSCNLYLSHFRKNSNIILKEFTIEELKYLFKSINTTSYKFIFISEKLNMDRLIEIKKLVEKHGFSNSDLFGIRSHIVDNTQEVIEKYIAGEPYPLK